jgi:hypothetical protein
MSETIVAPDVHPVSPAQGAVPAKRPGLVGYLDASSGSRLFGWAWDPERPTMRIAIRLVAKGDTVTALIADRPRADLKANGIGDGAHAFEVDLPTDLRREDVEIRAVCPESGETLALAPPPRLAATSEAAADDSETLVRLVRSHGLLHRTVKEALTAITELRERSQDPPEDTSDPLSSRIETIEAAILRIDALIAEHETRLRERMRWGADRITRALCATALLFGGLALLTTLLQRGS